MKKIIYSLLLSIVPAMAFSDTGSISVDDVDAPALSVYVRGPAATQIWNDLAIPSVAVTSGETGSKVLYLAKVGKSILCTSLDSKGNAPYTCFLTLNSRTGAISRP